MFLTQTAIFDIVKSILVERFAVSPELIVMTVDMQKELELDSMDAVDLLLAVNERFQIRIPEQVLESIHTVADLVAVIEKNQ